MGKLLCKSCQAFRHNLPLHIIQERNKRKMTASNLASLAKISAQYICDIENYRRTPSKAVLNKILAVFDEEWFEGLIVENQICRKNP